MKATDYIAEFLSAQGVTHAFELVGGMITHLVDSIERHGETRIVCMHHEQGAAFAAEAYGRMTGVPGVAMATSGPGATNLLTGVGSCHFDSVPAVFITGQVNRSEQKGDRAIRQLGFQETDIVSMVAPITKAAWRVQEPEDLPALLTRAFQVALSGRPGPVLLDIPMDVQRADVGAEILPRITPEPEKTVEARGIEELLGALRTAQRPLILAGGGIRSAQAAELFRAFVDRANVPVVQSLMGVDTLPYAHPLRVGMIGSYGNRWANHALGNCDLLLVLGSRLDVRQTGADTESFRGGRTIYHVDVEAGEVNNRVTGCYALLADLRTFLTAALRQMGAQPLPAPSRWLAEVERLRQEWPDTAELRDMPGINPNVLMHSLSSVSGSAAAYVVDVGQHQMWAAQSLELGAHQRFLTSGGMGAMGYALPSAVGAAFASDRPVVLVAGDGGFQINIQELQTIARNCLPIKMVVVNNQCHGMVRQFQQSYFDERYQSTLWGYSAPDFTAVARAYGIDARTAEEPGELDAALEWLWRDPGTPALLQVMIDTFINAYPKIACGHPITEMEPFATPVQMEST
jgi:acetolactate synthase I/II/III large subunit